jgi:hypothetical protein
MVTTIYCTPTAKGVHSFYIEASGETHFLFSQDYRRGVNEYFRDGVRLDDALNFSRAKGDNAIKRTMEKLPKHIEYIEREYDLEILRKTAKKNAKHYKRAA